MARIAYLLGHFPTLTETFVGAEMRALEALGHKVFPIALHNPHSDFQPEDAGLAARTRYFSPLDPEASRMLARQYRFRRWRAYRFLTAQTTEPHYALLVHAADIANHIRATGCQHIHAHFAWGASTYAIAAAKLLGLPVTFTCHGSDVYARPMDLVLKCRAASAVIGVAPTITADLRRMAPSTRHVHIACGVDTKRFQPSADASTINGRWLFVGRLISCKGVDDILAAWSQLPAATRPPLDIVGDGPLRESLMDYAATHGLADTVHFLGAKNAPWLAEQGPHYRAMVTAFKQGEDGSRDTFPMVLKEAMAMGLPIVTTRFIDIPELVTGCAQLCSPSDPAQLREAVAKVEAMSESDRLALGAAGRLRVMQYYSLTEHATKLAALFSSL